MIKRTRVLVIFGIILYALISAEQRSDQDKMALSGLTSNHNKTFGADKLIKTKKDTDILMVNIDPVDYESWVIALTKFLTGDNKFSDENTKKDVIKIQRANAQLKRCLDSVEGLDKKDAATAGKIKEAINDVNQIKADLTNLKVDPQSLIYAAYESVRATVEKVSKELGNLLSALQGVSLISYDRDNVIKKDVSSASYDGREKEIKRLFDGISVLDKSKSSVIDMKDALIKKNKELQNLAGQLKKNFSSWFTSDWFIVVPNRTEAEKDNQGMIIKSTMEKVRQAQRDLDDIENIVKKYPKFKEIYDYLVSKFTILERNIDELKIAIATK